MPYSECQQCGRAPRDLGYIRGASKGAPIDRYITVHDEFLCREHCWPALEYGSVLAADYAERGLLRAGEVLIASGLLGEDVNTVVVPQARGQAAAEAALSSWADPEVVRIWWLVAPSPDLPHGVQHQAVGTVADVRAVIADWPEIRTANAEWIAAAEAYANTHRPTTSTDAAAKARAAGWALDPAPGTLGGETAYYAAHLVCGWRSPNVFLPGMTGDLLRAVLGHQCKPGN